MATSCTISGLTDGLGYSVPTRIRNAAGWSHHSPAESAVRSAQHNCALIGPHGSLQVCTLPNANLTFANLVNANLGAAALETTNLTDADLVGAELAGAFLGFANLSGAVM